MKLYYIVFDYGHGKEMIAGPYGTYTAAFNDRMTLMDGLDDEKLVIMSQKIDMSEE